jgi:isoleucyl-tRNA synthetase
VLWKITDALARLVAPILSFLADEVWQHLATDAKRDASVHTTLFPTADELAPAGQEAMLDDWAQLLSIRDNALLRLEEARKEKRIGKALEAKLLLVAAHSYSNVLKRYQGSLKELLNVSQVELLDSNDGDPHSNEETAAAIRLVDGGSQMVESVVFPADGEKCARCWNYRTDIGADSRWPTVCGRCADALKEIGFPPLSDEEPA